MHKEAVFLNCYKTSEKYKILSLEKGLPGVNLLLEGTKLCPTLTAYVIFL